MSGGMSSDTIERRIEIAREAVRAETELLHREFGRARSEIKHDGSRVTAADLAISRNIQARLAAEFPGDQFFSEELAADTQPVPVTSRFSWVLDPIDGTNNYANGIIHCAISLALLERGEPVYGVIYDMARRVFVHGGPGRGVWDGERRATVRTSPPDSLSLIGFHSPVEKRFAEDGKRLIESYKIRGLGSSALHLAYTAIGLLDGVVEHNNRMWDIAAACAFLSEAGVEIRYLTDPPFPLKVFTLKAPRVRYVAGNHETCAALLKVVSAGSVPAG